MRIAIIQFPGSNCEAESLRAVRAAGMEAEEFLWNRNPLDLVNFDGFFIVGGFSYEDRSRAGIIASLDPLMAFIKKEAAKGKPVLGICNGAQILVETGMVPGLPNDALCMALATNTRIQHGKVVGTGFYNAWVHMILSASPEKSAFTRHMKNGEILRVPVAHGEGKFIIPEELLEQMKQCGLTTFRYSDPDGNIKNEFPINPNGTVYNLAAVTNTAGNVMAMMPHPERTSGGLSIFTSMRDYIADKKKSLIKAILSYIPPARELTLYTPPPTSVSLPIKLLIADNQATTVEKTLERLGITVSVERYTHWEISPKPTHEIPEGSLWNPKKEQHVPWEATTQTITLLVRYRDDIVGKRAKETLADRLRLTEITDVRHGTLWRITIREGDPASVLQKILDTNILYNPYSQICLILGNNPLSPMNSYTEKIQKEIQNTLTATDLGIGKKKIGKVRDTYDCDDSLILVTTDRLSAFDRVLASIPFKGQVLNQTSAWWFEKTRHIVPNHVISIPDPNVTIGKKCTVFPVEFVVRGYITGSTSTSAWVNYEKGVRNYCGQVLPEGLKKNQKFDRPLLTPTTKSDTHDRLISPEEIVKEGLMTQEDWEYTGKKALELFAFGQQMATSHGLILVDTKYEFGKDANGQIMLIDETHTPDSSRYWLLASYADRMARGLEPENIDKEFLRLWFKEHADPYKDPTLPQAPDELVVELSRRYIMLFEMITGEKFKFPEAGMPIHERIKKNIGSIDSRQSKADNQKPTIKALLILGSAKDEDHAKKITEALTEYKIPYEQYVASAHKEADKALQILEKYKNERVVYITMAGRSNALSGFVAGNSNKVTIACPPFADKTDMLVNIHSTIQMPSNVPVMTILEPANVALAVKRMIELF